MIRVNSFQQPQLYGSALRPKEATAFIVRTLSELQIRTLDALKILYSLRHNGLQKMEKNRTYLQKSLSDAKALMQNALKRLSPTARFFHKPQNFNQEGAIQQFCYMQNTLIKTAESILELLASTNKMLPPSSNPKELLSDANLSRVFPSEFLFGFSRAQEYFPSSIHSQPPDFPQDQENQTQGFFNWTSKVALETLVSLDALKNTPITAFQAYFPEEIRNKRANSAIVDLQATTQGLKFLNPVFKTLLCHLFEKSNQASSHDQFPHLITVRGLPDECHLPIKLDTKNWKLELRPPQQNSSQDENWDDLLCSLKICFLFWPEHIPNLDLHKFFLWIPEVKGFALIGNVQKKQTHYSANFLVCKTEPTQQFSTELTPLTFDFHPSNLPLERLCPVTSEALTRLLLEKRLLHFQVPPQTLAHPATPNSPFYSPFLITLFLIAEFSV